MTRLVPVPIPFALVTMYIAVVAIEVALTGANLSPLALRRFPIALTQITTQFPAIMLNGFLITSDIAVIAANILTSILVPVTVTPAPPILGHSAPDSENSHQHSSNQCTFHFPCPSRAAYGCALC